MNPHIAYCFLTYQDLERPDIWNLYFQHQQNFSVYIHSKTPIQSNLYSFPIFNIPNPILTNSKTNIQIVRATLHLLKYAYETNPDISHFVFLTQSCIPIYSFSTHWKLISSLPKSCISVFSKNQMQRYHSLSLLLKQKIPFHQFSKQQPNMILIKEDVTWLIENNYTKDFERMECPDEHYFINLFLFVYRKSFFPVQIDFCNPLPNRTQAILHKHISKTFIQQLRNQHFLFLRKVNHSSQIDISSLFNP
jgi:hypothetical protein